MALPSPNLLDTPTSPTSLVPPKVPQSAPVQPVQEDEKREFGDIAATRRNIYDRVLQAAQTAEPVSNQTHTLRLANVKYADPEQYSIADQKKAILGGRSQGRRVRGTWELVDNATGGVVDSRNQVIFSVPYMTSHGTYVHNGSEYSLRNQQRLRPGIFARRKNNGELEAHANILPGKGVSHRYYLDPERGVFRMSVGQAQLPLLPLLKAMGATPKQLREAWGPEIYAANQAKDEASALAKIEARFLRKSDIEGLEDLSKKRELLVKRFAEMELDPEVTKRTLGYAHKGMTLDAILDTTSKLLAISNGEKEYALADGSRYKAEVDDRDGLPYQQFLGPEDLFAERIARDHGHLRKQLLFKATAKGNLASVPSSALKQQVEQALLGSGLGQALEEINPSEILDKQYGISRLGEGGIPNNDAVPDEARDVQPSHFGFMDPLRTPESARAGVDLYMARGARKGRDGKIYSKFRDMKGQEVWKTPQEAADMTIAFPGAMRSKSKRVLAMRNGREKWVPRDEVDLELGRMEDGFSPLANMVPLMSQVKGQRAVMASRMYTQAVPLVKGEAPLVQAAMPDTQGGRSYEEEYAKSMGALRADKAGTCMGVTPEGIRVKYDDGTEDTVEVYDNYPFNRKTYLHQTPVVKPGDRFDAGALLARSNYTDDQGTTALGANLRTAYIPWQGKNFEDAVVISESAAREALASEHMYQNELDVDDRVKTGLKDYVGLFPGRFKKDTLKKLDDRGIIKPGTTVEKGDPLILAARQRETSHNKVHKKGQAGYADATVTWDHHDPGIVTDVVDGKKGPVVVVKSKSTMQVGDKLSGRYGDKGVVSAIIPDAQMPHDSQGRAFQVLLSPLGVQTRTNPAQKVELALGKLAELEGKPQKVEDWGDFDYTEWAYEKLRKAGLSPDEEIVDPTSDRKIKDVSTGNRFFMKLHHTAEAKGQARGGGAYTMEDAPAKGGPSGSKRVALLDANALLSHGATETLRDVGAIRGQRNEDMWMQFMQGYNPQAPRVPTAYTKFVNQLRASGINVVRSGTQTNIMAMTDKDVDRLCEGREVSSGEGVDWNRGLAPIKGGLFDKKLTGGHNGKRWCAVKFAEPMPNPVMEEPIRHVLGLTQKQLESTISGEHNLPKFGTGPQAISKALSAVNVDKEIALARAKMTQGSKTERDKAVRRLGYLKSAQKLKIHPGDWVLKRAPVLPPAFRPVSMMGKDMPLVSDPNFLYKELMEANSNLASMTKEVGEDNVGPERLAVYKAFKGVTGLGDPISQKSRDKGVRGLLKSVFGNSPKWGTVQRKLISTTVDNVGRAVITPNPDFDMDTVGIPETKAFDVYGKFVARRLRRRGMKLSTALRHIKDQDETAREALMEEMDERPVFINRAPVLHKYGVMAFKPKIVKGDTMQVSPLIVKGFNADFDGDAMNFHVPSSEEAVDEALDRMLPSKSLISPADFKTPMHMPSQDYVGGLYYATKGKSKRPKKIFNTMADARKALARGEINMNDQIEVLEA